MIRSLAIVCVLASTARANPHPLPFSYPYETLTENKVEIAQYMDLVPVRVERENPGGALDELWGVRSVLTTRLDIGLTDNLEAGFYFQFRQGASSGTPGMRFDGVKQRLRYRFAETGELPVDLAVSLEIAEFQNELGFEERLLISKRVGDVVLVANLWVEQRWYFQDSTTRYIYNPTAGAAYEVSPRFQVGLEYWARGRFDDTSDDPVTLANADGSDAPTKAHHYLGPTFLYEQGPLFFSIGAYVRMDNFGDATITGDAFGKLWIRSILGLEL